MKQQGLLPIYDQNGDPYMISADHPLEIRLKPDGISEVTCTLFIKDVRGFIKNAFQKNETNDGPHGSGIKPDKTLFKKILTDDVTTGHVSGRIEENQEND